MSEVPVKELGNPDCSTLHLHRVPEVRVSDSLVPTGESLPLPTSIKEREVLALETQAKALQSISTFLSGITLKDVLQHTAVHSAASQLLGGLTSNAGRSGLDARTMKQNAIDIAYLIEAVIGKLSTHAASRSDIKDGEELMGLKKDGR